MIGKAIYEGIVLEAALADFFAAKLLGKHNSIDELRSLDPGLHSSLEVPRAQYARAPSPALTSPRTVRSVGAQAVRWRRRERSVSHVRGRARRLRRARDCRAPGRRRGGRGDQREPHRVHSPDGGLQAQPRAVRADARVRRWRARGGARRLAAPILDSGAAAADPRRRRAGRRGGHAPAHAVRRRLPRPRADDPRPVVGPRRMRRRGPSPLRQVRHGMLEAAAARIRAPAAAAHHTVRLGPGGARRAAAPPRRPLPRRRAAHCRAAPTAAPPPRPQETPSVLALFGVGRTETTRLPTASTCFNLLKLPNFKNKKASPHPPQHAAAVPRPAPGGGTQDAICDGGARACHVTGAPREATLRHPLRRGFRALLRPIEACAQRRRPRASDRRRPAAGRVRVAGGCGPAAVSRHSRR